MSRFVSYLFPGDSEPLCTEELSGKNPIFAASVAHSLTLAKGKDVASKLLDMAREANEIQKVFDGRSLLEFGLWEKITEETEPVLSASATIPLSSLAELGFAAKSICESGLCASAGIFVTVPLNNSPGGNNSQLLVQLQYDLTPSSDLLEEEVEDEASTVLQAPSPAPAMREDPPRFTALLSVDIIQATGLSVRAAALVPFLLKAVLPLVHRRPLFWMLKRG